MKASFLTSSDGWKRVVAGAVFSVCLQGSLLAAHIDWDGGTMSTNTTAGGSANVASNWSSDTIPGLADDVFLNDVFSLDAVTRAITVDAPLTWKSLTMNQSTAPSSGSNSNVLSLAVGTSLIVTSTTPVSVSGAANAIGVLELGSGSLLVISNATSPTTLSFGTHTVLTGSGSITNIGTDCTIIMNGTINGAITNRLISRLVVPRNHRVTLGATARVAGAPSWQLRGNNMAATAPANFDCLISDATQWQTTPRVELWGAAGVIEALSSTVNPSTSSHYKFSTIQFGSTGYEGTTEGGFRVVNTCQNDGDTAGTKEALYAASFTAPQTGDGSNGRFVIDLNGQDLYTDSLAAGFVSSLGWRDRGIVCQNSFLNSVSIIRALATSVDCFVGGFQVLNGATLELVGGSWNNTIYSRNTGMIPADSAAAPNVATGNNSKKTRRWDGVAENVGGFNHFLGSGADAGGNANTTAKGTSGTLRIVGGEYATSGLILNPLNTTGVIDTLSSNPSYPDTVANNVTLRSGTIQAVTNVNTTTGFLIAPNHRYRNGNPVKIFLNSTAPAGLNTSSIYYIVNAVETGFQLAATPGGAPIIPSTTGSNVAVTDMSGAQASSTQPGLIVAGQTTITGSLSLPVVGGASGPGTSGVPGPAFQSTLRVGGIYPVSVGVAVDAASDTLTLASGSVSNGQAVVFSGTTVPTGLIFGQVYYARNVVGSAFQVAVGPAESAVDIINAGASVSLVSASPTNSAVLTVTGDLTTESRTVTSKIWNNGYNNYNITVTANGINGNGAVVTVTNSSVHGLLTGDTIVVAGGNAGFNGTFTVASVPTPLVFTYSATGSGAGGNATFVFSKTASANVAIQSNATVNVGGNITISSVGRAQNNLVTGTGVGISPYSQFTLNGGLATTQTVSIVPPVGIFHVGEGANGVLTGTAANALLAATLTVAGALDVNGSGVIAGTTAGAGIALTNGADLVLGDAAAIAVAGPLSLASGSTVDLSQGSISVGALDVGTGAVIDFKDRTSVDNQLRVAGNVKAQLQAEIAASRIISSHVGLAARYDSIEDTSTIISVRGTMISIK